ncbi:MerR family transcriptional regulator [Enterococcus sp. LJL128]|uniref:MerR family transcriptional regulator n=1 Tax=Enterococcus sp. LJL51 TaxID=3416656 RepID=UPI003CF1F1E5
MSISIQRLAKELGVTSRTIRYWEAVGLTTSIRNPESGWRMYSMEEVLKIKIIHCLRSWHFSIKEVSQFLAAPSYRQLANLTDKKIKQQQLEKKELSEELDRLENLKQYLQELMKNTEAENHLEWGEKLMDRFKRIQDKAELQAGNELTFALLPAMRMAYTVVVNKEPESEALEKMLLWLEAEELLGTARIFGGDMPPKAKKAGDPYGYGVCASIPKNIQLPGDMKELLLPGGVYAVFESTENIPASWGQLMLQLKQNKVYTSDRSRLCLEEHIKIIDEKGNESYRLQLFEPVKKRVGC